MKIRFLKNVSADVQKRSDEELWWKQFRKWDELKVETLDYLPDKKSVNVVTWDGDTICSIPVDSFEILK